MSDAYSVQTETSGWSFVVGPRKVPNGPWRYKWEAQEEADRLNAAWSALPRLWQAVVDNTKGDLFWIGEILLSELEKETGFRGPGVTAQKANVEEK